MKLKSLLLTLVFSALATSALAAPTECPKTYEEWIEWRSQLVKGLTNPEQLLDGRAKFLTDCAKVAGQSKFFKSVDFTSCMQPLKNELEVIQLLKENDLSAALDANDLIGRTQSIVSASDSPDVTALPEFFKTNEFISATKNKQITEEEVSNLLFHLTKKHKDSLVIRFNSRFDAGDRSILTLVPGKKVDRFLHMVWDKDSFAGFVFLIGVEKIDNNGKILNPPRSFFTGYVYDKHVFESDDQQQQIESTPQLHKEAMKKMMKQATLIASLTIPATIAFPQVACYTCHRTGGMPIVPSTESPLLFSYIKNMDAKTAIEKFNSKIEDEATATPPSLANLNFGPAIGPIDPPTRTADFIKSCSIGLNLTPGSIANVAHAMNCQSCHDGDQVNPLTFPLGMGGELGHAQHADGFDPGGVFRGMVSSNHMPLREFLTPNEAEATQKCLIAEYYGGFTDSDFGTAAFPNGIFLNSLLEKKCK